MSQRPSDVMRMWFERVWCNHDQACIDELFAADGIATGLPGGDSLQGPEGFRTFFHGMNATFDAIHVEVLDAVDEGERCYTRCRATLGFQNRSVTLEGGALSTVRAGQIVHSHNCWDFLGLLQDMGALQENAFTRAALGVRFEERPPEALQE